jgi:hypothetical protein
VRLRQNPKQRRLPHLWQSNNSCLHSRPFTLLIFRPLKPIILAHPFPRFAVALGTLSLLKAFSPHGMIETLHSVSRRTSMPIKHDMSNKTLNKLIHLIAKMRQSAAQRDDQETYKDADDASFLLRNFANELQIEEDHQT